MGYIRHDAVVVTGEYAVLDRARIRAMELGLRTTNLVVHGVGYDASFLIIPDGSREGWIDSTRGAEARAVWVAWARRHTTGLCWVAVSYAGDDPEDTRIVDSEPRS